MINFGDVIPKGYVVEIESWENDADDFRTEMLTGLSLNDVMFLKVLLPQFNSKNARNNNGYGNSDISEYEIMQALYDCGEEFKVEIENFFDITYKEVAEYIDGDQDYEDDPDVFEMLYENLCGLISYPVQYDHGFCRVFESMNVYMIDEEITIPKPKLIADLSIERVR